MIFFEITWPDGHQEWVSIYGTELNLNTSKTATRALKWLADRRRDKHGARFEVKWEIIDVPTIH